MILSRYLFRIASRHILLTGFALLVVFAVIEFFDSARVVLGPLGSAGDALKYYALRLPHQLLMILPLAVLLGSVTAYGGLVRSREILAARAGGVSTARLAIPGMIAALLFGLAAAGMAEWVVPRTDKEADRVRVEVFKGFTAEWTRFNAAGWFRVPGGLARVTVTSQTSDKLYGVQFFEIDGNYRLKRRIEAKALIHDQGRWRGQQFTEVAYGDDGTITRTRRKSGEIQLGAKPADFRIPYGRPHQLSMASLDEAITLRESQGRDVQALVIERHARFSSPLQIVISALLGLAIALGIRPGSGIIGALGKAIGLAFLVGAGIVFFNGLGRVEVVSASTAVWLPLLLFAALGLNMLRRVTR